SPLMNRTVEKENQFSELVEVVVETQAEVGASGYSVVGGGEQGIFIKEVLKDSPAAKHLSLQKGDQLLSARVYFDNVKYEDALKILQCAEPYKVSFFLKRTVPGSEVRIRPGAQNLELRGPKAKMQKMVHSEILLYNRITFLTSTVFLKNKKATAQADPVDVEFVFPKFKMRKGGKATADGSEHLEGVITSTKKKRKIRFLKMKAMDAALDVQSSNDSFEVKEQEAKFKPPSVECDFNMPQDKAETNVPNPEVSVKGKGEGPEIKMPKINLDVSDTMGTVPKFKLPKVRLSCHSDEIDGEARKETDTSENKLKMPKIDIKAPNVDLDLHFPKTKGKAGFKVVEVPDCNVKGTKINTAKPDTSLPVLNLDAKQRFGDDIDRSMDKEHKIFLPKPDIAVPKIETSGLPILDVSLPKMTAKNIDTEGHASTGVKYEMTKLDISLPKVISPEGEVIVEEPGPKGGTFHKPNISISLPKGKGEAKVDGHSEKGPNVKMPQIDISLPKMKLPQGKIDIDGPEVDISLPKDMLEAGADVEGHFGKGEKIQMPKVKSPEHAIAEGSDIKAGKLSMPSIEISLPKGKTEGNIEIGDPSVKGSKFKKPHLDVSIPKLKLSRGAINTEDPEVKGEKFQMPPIDISLPKGKIEASVEVEGHSGNANMPKLDLNMSLPEGKLNSQSPDVGKFSIPGVIISLPKGKTDEQINLEVEKGDKFQIPKSDISLPKLKSREVDFDVKRTNRKFHMPAMDISLPHKKDERDVNVEPSGKCGKVEMPKVDISLPAVKDSGVEISLPKMKSPQGDISIEGPDSKRFNMPSVDISFPKVTDTGDVDLKRHSRRIGKFDIPKLDISLPKFESTKGELSVEGPEFKGGELNIPSYNISSAEVKTGGDVCLEGKTKKGTKFQMPKLNINLPQIKSAGTEINIEGPELKGGKIDIPDVDISLTQGKVKGDGKVNVSKGGKFLLPQVDLSLPKIKTRSVEVNVERPDVKGSKVYTPSLDISLPKDKTEKNTDIEGHSGTGIKFEMPKTDVSLPKVKATEGEIGVEAPQIQGGKLNMPSIEMSFPNRKVKGNTDLDGKKTNLPKFVISSPKIKSSDGEINIDIKDGKFHMPSIDISLPGGRTGGDVTVEGHEGKGRKFEMPKLDVSLPKLKPSGGEIDVEVPNIKGGKIHMPSIDISLPGGGAGGDVDVAGHAGKGRKFEMPKLDGSLEGKKNKKKNELPDTDLEPAAPKEKIKGPKVKGSKFNIGMPKLKVSGLENDINKSGKMDAKFLKGGTDANLKADLQAPKIPELDFDIETAQANTNNSEEDKKQTGKVKIPKFGIPLPSLSSPEANIRSSQGKGHSINIDSEAEYESPRMPKLTKAVFVMVNPQIENTASIGGEASAEIVDEKHKQPKIKMKPSFGKSPSNEKEKAIYCEDEVETEGKSKTGKLKLPKVTFLSGQRGSFDVTPSGSDDGTGPSLNGDKYEKSMFGKLKMPKVEFFSPYSKDASEEEEMETSLKLRNEASGESKESKESKTISGTMSFPGLRKKTEKDEEVRKINTIVSSKAKTEMLAEREGSESPVPTVSAGFVSVTKSEEREETTWFKVPKVTLSPHSTGILNITPESSPKGCKSSLPCSSEEASGGFYVKMPSVEFLTREMPSEHLITKTEGTLTVVTKTTKYTETKSTSSKQ
uniref:Periaxin n=1 Tax=Sinocyclocheilus anshuiensis TaxID=1608454 RepID=A0A671LTQ1_9TELE